MVFGAMVGIFTVLKQARSPSKQVEFLPVGANVFHSGLYEYERTTLAMIVDTRQ